MALGRGTGDGGRGQAQVSEFIEELLSCGNSKPLRKACFGFGGVGAELPVLILYPHPMGIQGMLQPLPAACSASNSFITGNAPGETWERDSHPKDHPGPSAQGSELMHPS